MPRQMIPCSVEGCKEEGHRNVCPGDGRYHHHGGIHLKDSTSLVLTIPHELANRLCDAHFAIACAEWTENGS